MQPGAPSGAAASCSAASASVWPRRPPRASCCEERPGCVAFDLDGRDYAAADGPPLGYRASFFMVERPEAMLEALASVADRETSGEECYLDWTVRALDGFLESRGMPPVPEGLDARMSAFSKLHPDGEREGTDEASRPLRGADALASQLALHAAELAFSMRRLAHALQPTLRDDATSAAGALRPGAHGAARIAGDRHFRMALVEAATRLVALPPAMLAPLARRSLEREALATAIGWLGLFDGLEDGVRANVAGRVDRARLLWASDVVGGRAAHEALPC